MFTIQYLEPNAAISAFTASDVRARLRAAFDNLPIDIVIVGWDVPPALVEACAQETRRVNAQLYLWHPLLTGSDTLPPRLDWQTIALTGEPVSGYRQLPEFTFLCPNRSAVAEAVLVRLRQAIRRHPFDGVFLDRIRFPAPLPQLDRDLACFCADCQRAADLDLAEAQRHLRALFATADWLRTALRLIFAPDRESPNDLRPLAQFLDFREQTITRTVQAAAQVIREEGLAVGLDCFSPILTRSVGQNLTALTGTCDWIKVMTYAHAFGPAGLPYELSGLTQWLIERRSWSEADALQAIAEAAHLPLPRALDDLREQGLPPEILGHEIQRGRAAGVKTLLAGIELVDLEGVTRLNAAQIAADLEALRDAQPAGLALSWDLWWMPPERLTQVRTIWGGTPA